MSRSMSLASVSAPRATEPNTMTSLTPNLPQNFEDIFTVPGQSLARPVSH